MGLFTAIAAGAAVASAATGIAAAATAGGGGGGGRLKLTPEWEADMMATLNKDLAAIDRDMGEATKLNDALNSRLDMLDQIIQGGETPELLQNLAKNTLEVTGLLKTPMSELAKTGFVDPEDAARLDEVWAMQDAPAKGMDPELEQSLADDRAKYEQSLAGLSPDQKQRALARFDQEADVKRFSRKEEMLNERLGRAVSTGTAREAWATSGFNRFTSGVGTMAGMVEKGVRGLASTAATRFESGRATLSDLSALRAEGQSRYESLGQFDISKQGRQASEAGLIGPGSLYEQTGVPRSDMGRFRDYTRLYEQSVSPVRSGAERGWAKSAYDYRTRQYNEPTVRYPSGYGRFASYYS